MSSSVSHHDVARGDATDLINSRLALEHLAPAVAAQGDHAFLERLLADDRAVDALHAQVADLVAGHHQLVDAHAPAVAALPAGAAAGAAPQPQRPAVGRLGEVVRHLVVGVRVVLLLAVGADGADEAL